MIKSPSILSVTQVQVKGLLELFKIKTKSFMVANINDLLIFDNSSFYSLICPIGTLIFYVFYIDSKHLLLKHICYIRECLKYGIFSSN